MKPLHTPTRMHVFSSDEWTVIARTKKSATGTSACVHNDDEMNSLYMWMALNVHTTRFAFENSVD